MEAMLSPEEPMSNLYAIEPDDVLLTFRRQLAQLDVDHARARSPGTRRQIERREKELRAKMVEHEQFLWRLHALDREFQALVDGLWKNR